MQALIKVGSYKHTITVLWQLSHVWDEDLSASSWEPSLTLSPQSYLIYFLNGRILHTMGISPRHHFPRVTMRMSLSSLLSLSSQSSLSAQTDSNTARGQRCHFVTEGIHQRHQSISRGLGEDAHHCIIVIVCWIKFILSMATQVYCRHKFILSLSTSIVITVIVIRYIGIGIFKCEAIQGGTFLRQVD